MSVKIYINIEFDTQGNKRSQFLVINVNCK